MRYLVLAFALALASLAPSAQDACASMRTPRTSISDAKALVSALDIYFERMPGLGTASDTSADAAGKPIDRVKMAEGLADGISRLQPEQFNGLSQKLVTDYLAQRERRAEIEGFIELLSDRVEKQYRGKVSGLGVSAAEDALIVMAMLGTLHATPYAVDLTLKTGGKAASRIAGTAIFQRAFKGWSESRIWKGATIVPKLAWDLLVKIPSDAMMKLTRPVSRHWLTAYSAAAAVGVGHSVYELYQTSRMNPRQVLTLAQLKVIASFDFRLAELAELRKKTLAPAPKLEPEEVDVFGDAEGVDAAGRADRELAAMEEDLKHLLGSRGEGVSAAARQVLDRLEADRRELSPPA